MSKDSKLFDIEGERLVVSKISDQDTAYSNELSLNLEANKTISVWNDMDVEYKGNPKLSYHVELFDKDRNVKTYSFDALELSPVLRSGKKIFGKSDWVLKRKMGTIKVEMSGTYIFKTYLTSDSNKIIELRKAEVILKI